jgi:hypothetical protein
MIQEIGKQINCALTQKKQIKVDNQKYLEIDGYSESAHILCEAYAHIGKLKGAQRQKVLTDAIKMLYAEKLLWGDWRKILLFADDNAAKSFESGTWYAMAMEKFGIEIRVVSFNKETRKIVLDAQNRQVMQNVDGGT